MGSIEIEPSKPFSPPLKSIFAVMLALLMLGILTWAVWFYVGTGVDWHCCFRPAALAMLKGRSPYTVSGVFNPPWAFLPLLPLVFLPERTGSAIMFLLTVSMFGIAAFRMGARPIAIGILLASPLVIDNAVNNNLDWMVAIGATLPPIWGLFFVLVKPQIGAAIAVYWAANTYREGGVKLLIRTFAPVLLAYLLSFVIFGLWPLQMRESIGFNYNASLWPWSIPVGLLILFYAVSRGHKAWAIISSPLLSPYLAPNSWSIILLGLVRSSWITAAAVILMWILYLT